MNSRSRRQRPIERIPATLSCCPKTLFDLWHEYQFGLSDCKSAKEISLFKRGRVKSKYCRRQVFQDVIVNLVNAGHTSKFAIYKVYACHGRSTCVTKILLQIVKDRKSGGHPNLQVRSFF